jgi:GNAT superfamily N-acetyltransferase
VRTDRADSLSLAALTALWNRGYEGYFLPVAATEGFVAGHVRTHDVDLSSSLIAVDEGAPVAFSLLARRGDRGWIGGVGVVATHRGRGLAQRLFDEHMDVARGLGLAQVGLEVLRQNWARKVYSRAGFVVTRELMVLSGRLPVSERPADSWRASASDWLAHHARLHASFPACWQREAASARAFADDDVVLAVGPRESPSGLLVLGTNAGSPRVRGAATEDDASAASLVRALCARCGGETVSLVNEPSGSPLHRALLAVGLAETMVQYEMAWTR